MKPTIITTTSLNIQGKTLVINIYAPFENPESSLDTVVSALAITGLFEGMRAEEK